MSVRRLDDAGDPIFGRSTSIIPSGSFEVATRLGMNLKLMKDEWFLDRTVGVALLDVGSGEPRVFGGHADPDFLASEVKRVVLSTDGVSALLSFSLDFDHETRRADVKAVVSDVYGQAIPIKVIIP